MPQRDEYPGIRYLGNKNTKEVHDLYHDTGACQVDEIIAGGHAVPFATLTDAHREGYDHCGHCQEGSTR